MHELQVASELIKVLQGAMAQHGVDVISMATIKLGELTCIDPDSLRSAFEIVREGTPLDGVHLNFECCPVEGWCDRCEGAFPCEETDFKCPQCGGPPARYVSGEEFFLASMEVPD